MKKKVKILLIIVVLSLLLVMPSTAAFVTATISPSVVEHGEKIFINGFAEEQPASVAIWIFGDNFVGKQTVPVNVDGSYSYEIQEDTTRSMYSGMYFIVVQHPEANGVYDIDWAGAPAEYVYDYSGTIPVSIFKINGPGCLQGFDAFEALTQGIKQPYIDDIYTKLQFLILSKSKIGIFRNGNFFLRNSNSNGAPDIMFAYGAAGDIPIAGNWDGNGVESIGIFRNGNFFLRNSNSNGAPDLMFAYGAPGDVPVIGDWDGSGNDTIGIFRNGNFFLRNSNSNGAPDLMFAYGAAGDIPVVGDWDGNGIDSIGVFRNGNFFLRNSNTNGAPDLMFAYGASGDKPVVRDWDGNGNDTIGIFRNGNFFLRNSNSNGAPDLMFAYGAAGDVPVVGDWNGL